MTDVRLAYHPEGGRTLTDLRLAYNPGPVNAYRALGLPMVGLALGNSPQECGGTTELEAPSEFVFVAQVRRLELFGEILHRQLRLPRFQGAQPDQVQTLDAPARALHRHAEFLDGVIEEPHLFVGNAEVVVGVVIPFRHGLADALLEGLEDSVEAVVGRPTCE